MNEYIYKPKGVCSEEFVFLLEGDIIRDVKISGGCAGNLAGISVLLKDNTIENVIKAFEGIECGHKPTSCPDQIAQALKEYLVL